MIRRLLAPLLFFAFSFAHAETIKTDVLVIGGGPVGVAAAIQSARSKVKTLLVESGPFLGGDIIKAGGTCVLDANRNLPSGIWGEFRRRITDHYSTRPCYDTTYNAVLRFEPYDATELLKKWTDTVKNLTVKMNTACTNIKKDGTGWEVVIVANGETVTIKTKVVIDATDNGDVAAKAGVKLKDRFDNHKDYGDKEIYRTSIATGEALPDEKYKDANTNLNNYPPYPSYCIPLNAVLSTGADNLLIIDKDLPAQ